MIEVSALWDFDDPARSEDRFRAALADASPEDRGVLLTQVARALGLQGRYDDGHAVLDAVDTAGAEVATRVALERGRLLRSAGDPAAASPHFDAAVALASAAGLEALHVDALHMAALVAPVDRQVALTEQALAVARWMVAWALRNLGRRDEALALQRELRSELEAAGAHDPYVDEEIALLEAELS